jgi:hypothetical protein
MQAKAASVARRIETGCGGIILQPKPDERRLNVAFPKTEQVEIATELSSGDFVNPNHRNNLLPETKIMSEKKVVRVVKRAERSSRKPGSARAAREAARKTATNMVTNVTNWVTEFQQKQSVETAKAVESLIRSRQQPNEA